LALFFCNNRNATTTAKKEERESRNLTGSERDSSIIEIQPKKIGKILVGVKVAFEIHPNMELLLKWNFISFFSG
jgi:hypothetical protein